MGTKLIIVRHAETDWNKELKYQGQQDIVLNDTGKEQAVKLSNYLSDSNIDTIYSSNLKRAYSTAKKINKFHNLKIKQEKELREIDFGKWEGMTYSKIKAHYPEILKKWNQNPTLISPPAGEDLKRFKLRIVNVFAEIVEENREKNILVVTHGGAIKAYLTFILGIPLYNYWQFNISSTGISIINVYEEKYIIKSLNIIEHLK